VKYDALAPIYDRLMYHVEYDEWVSLIGKVISKFSSVKSPEIFEIGGGTGILGQRLIAEGYSYQGSDFSFQMCREAKSKGLPFFCADGRILPLKQHFDLVIFLYDGINYLLTLDEYASLFSQVVNILSKGGLFLFDITTETNSISHFIDYLDFEDYGDYYFVRRSYYDDTNTTQYNEFTIFKLDQKIPPLYHKYKEKHEQKIFPAKLLEETIPRSHFQIVSIFDGYTFRKYSSKSERIHFLLKKI
jgi:ubiquinone/menaquinone biosynthesis C-methylase UbiE